MQRVMEELIGRYGEREEQLVQHINHWFDAFEELSTVARNLQLKLGELTKDMDSDDEQRRADMKKLQGDIDRVIMLLGDNQMAAARQHANNVGAVIERERVLVRREKAWLWVGVAGSVAVAGAGFGTYFYLDARHKWDEAQRACPGAVCPNDEGYRLSREALRSAEAANIAFGVAGAGLITGAVLWLVIDGGSPFEQPVVKEQPLVALSVGPSRAHAAIATQF